LNFDASYELEEILLEENPLRAKKRSAKRDYSKLPGGETGEMAKELLKMEKRFAVSIRFHDR
jgi:serine/threonine kinase 32